MMQLASIESSRYPKLTKNMFGIASGCFRIVVTRAVDQLGQPR